MPKEFILRGKIAVNGQTKLNFSGGDRAYGYQLKKFQLWGADDILGASAAFEYCGVLSADNVAADPIAPDFNDPAQIGVALWGVTHNLVTHVPAGSSVIDDLFIITQDLILAISGSASTSCNYLLKFEQVKLSGPAEAANNYKQYLIFDD